MVHWFVSPDGRPLPAPEERDGLRAFALENKLITRPKDVGNVIELLKPLSGKKHLNFFVPLHKLRWLAQVDKCTNRLSVSY